MNWIIKCPITIRVCLTLTARSKAEAMRKAKHLQADLESRYYGAGCDLSRPPLVGTTDERAWLEHDDETDILRLRNIDATPAEE